MSSFPGAIWRLWIALPIRYWERMVGLNASETEPSLSHSWQLTLLPFAAYWWPVLSDLTKMAKNLDSFCPFLFENRMCLLDGCHLFRCTLVQGCISTHLFLHANTDHLLMATRAGPGAPTELRGLWGFTWRGCVGSSLVLLHCFQVDFLEAVIFPFCYPKPRVLGIHNVFEIKPKFINMAFKILPHLP